MLAATLLVGCSNAESAYVKPRQDALKLTEIGRLRDAEAKLVPLVKIMQSEHAASLPNATQQLAWVYMCDGKYKEAEDLALKAQFHHDKNSSSDVESKILDDYTLATIYRKIGKYDQAEPLYREAIDLRQETIKKNAPASSDKIVEAPRLASLQLGMGELEFDTGKYIQAQSQLQDAVKSAEADKLEKKPGSSVVLADTMLAVAQLEVANGKFLDAESIVNRVIMLKGDEIPKHGPLSLRTMLVLLAVLTAQHRHAEADGIAQNIWIEGNTLYGREDHPQILQAKLLNMPNVPHLHPEIPHEEIQSLYDRLITNFAEVYGAESPHLIAPYQAAGMFALSNGDYEKAESNLRSALTLSRQKLGEHHPRTIGLLDDLALTLGFKDLNTNSNSDLPEAKELARLALAKIDDSLPEDNPLRARAPGVLASVFSIADDSNAAYDTFKDYLSASKTVNYEDPVERIRFLKNYQAVCEKTGHVAEAKRIQALFADTTPLVHASVGKSGKVPLVLK